MTRTTRPALSDTWQPDLFNGADIQRTEGQTTAGQRGRC